MPGDVEREGVHSFAVDAESHCIAIASAVHRYIETAGLTIFADVLICVDRIPAVNGAKIDPPAKRLRR